MLRLHCATEDAAGMSVAGNVWSMEYGRSSAAQMQMERFFQVCAAAQQTACAKDSSLKKDVTLRASATLTIRTKSSYQNYAKEFVENTKVCVYKSSNIIGL
jgi:hypothetical protein